jgi:hypothetical protein
MMGVRYAKYQWYTTLGSEGFAHFFEAVERNDTEKTSILKQSFPEAFKLFEKMMEELV